MPRKLRIEIPGYYHIINRGVEQRVVFYQKEDFKKFEELLCDNLKVFDINLHSFCLMSNHYHILVETKNENLSKFMRQINMNYAIYFNKKYKRVGHLWQGRYKSVYITDEAYLYTLIQYIEQNPLKAKIIDKIGAYPYQSSYYLLNNNIPKCLSNSWLSKNFGKKDGLEEFLYTKPDEDTLQELKKASMLTEAPNIKNNLNEKKLKNIFSNATDKKIRNKKIVSAYKKGYSQHLIAKVLGLSQPTVNAIIKRNKDNKSII